MQRLLLLLAFGVLTACPNGNSTQPPDDPGPDDPGPGPDPVPMTAGVRLALGEPEVRVGEVREVGEVFNTPGMERVEWDFDYDGTTFSADAVYGPWSAAAEPVRVYFGRPGTVTVAVRALYPGAIMSPVGTLDFTVDPPADPDRFRPTSLDIGALVFEAPVYRSPYVNVWAHGGQAIAAHGESLLAGYWAIESGQAGYYLTGSTSGGARWSPPVKVSSDPADAPGILREPALVLAPAGAGFLAVWQGGGEASLRYAVVQVSGDPAALEISAITEVAPLAGQTLAVAPALFTDPVNPSSGRLLWGAKTAASPALAVRDWSTDGPNVTFAATPFTFPHAGVASKIRGGWTHPDRLLVALEQRAVSLGGTGGGGQSSVTVSVDLAVLTRGHALARTEILKETAQPARTPDYQPALGVASERFCFGWYSTPLPPFDPGGLNLVGGIYTATGIAVDGSYPVWTGRTDISHFAATATGDGFLFLYTLPRLDVLAEIATGRTEELYAARLPLVTGAPLYVDHPVNTGDPDGNEGLTMPSVIAESDGTAYAVWVEADWNRARNGRLGFNRTG